MQNLIFSSMENQCSPTTLQNTYFLSTQVFFNLLWVPYMDQESKLGDTIAHRTPLSPRTSWTVMTFDLNYKLFDDTLKTII